MRPNLQKLIHNLEKKQKTYWNISSSTGKFLNLLIKDRKYKTVLEIGTSNGYSGLWIAEALKETSGHLHTIESNFRKRFPLAIENFKKSGLSKYITQILGHAPEAIPKTPKYFDLAFLDATKEEHARYFQVLKNRIKKGGIIITDNIISHKKALLPFIRAIKNDKDWFSIKLNFEDGLLISLKTT